MKFFSDAKEKAQAVLLGALVRKKYRFNQLAPKHLESSEIFALGNDPTITGLESYTASTNGKPLLIATSGLRSLLLACQLGNPLQNKMIPQLILIDESKHVIHFWRDFRKFVASEAGETEKSFAALFPLFIERHIHHIVKNKSSNPKEEILQFCLNLFDCYGYGYVHAIICNAKIIAQTWGDESSFQKIKNVVDYLKTENVYAYPSNIYLLEYVDIGIKILNNIKLINPKLAIHTDFNFRSGTPKSVRFFSTHHPEQVSQTICQPRQIPCHNFQKIKIGDKFFGVFDEKDISLIKNCRNNFYDEKHMQEKLQQFNLIFSL
jgi:hypothetical protein